jgi:hypothetical protein
MMLLVASDGGRIITDFVREGGLIAHALFGRRSALDADKLGRHYRQTAAGDGKLDTDDIPMIAEMQ